MKTLKEKILERMKVYYNSEQKALSWYETPNFYFKNSRDERLSPKTMVEQNKGNEVLDWIKITIGY